MGICSHSSSRQHILWPLSLYRKKNNQWMFSNLSIYTESKWTTLKIKYKPVHWWSVQICLSLGNFLGFRNTWSHPCCLTWLQMWSMHCHSEPQEFEQLSHMETISGVISLNSTQTPLLVRKNTGTCPITFPDRRGPQYSSYSWTDWTSKKRHKIVQCFFFSLLDHMSLFIGIIKLLIFTSTPCRTVFVSRLETKMKSLVSAEATKSISKYVSMNHYTSVGMLVEKK